MTEHRVNQSNPFSTGGGGTNFEVSVQTYFASCMLMGFKIQGLKDDKIVKIKLQGRYEGYDTDDCIVYGSNGNKLLCQIKHSISITKTNLVFKDVIEAAWNDFCNTDLFNIKKDRIALVVSGLSKKDEDTITILEWACSCENEVEFLKKLNLPKFSSKSKQSKYEAIKHHLENTSNGDISDKKIWTFLQSFFILVLDLDRSTSSINTNIDSALEKLSGEKNLSAKVYKYISNLNQNAGTILLDKLVEELNIKKSLVFNDYCNLEADKQTTEIILKAYNNGVCETKESKTIDLTKYFEDRHIKDNSMWNNEIKSEIKKYTNLFFTDDKVYTLDLSAHYSSVYYMGLLLNSKTGKKVKLKQRTVTDGIKIWEPSLTLDNKQYQQFKIKEEALSGLNEDIVICISAIRDISGDIKEFLSASNINVKKFINFILESNGNRSVENGEHSYQLAEQIKQVLDKRSLRERSGKIHLFISAPASLVFFLGQLSFAINNVYLYEYTGIETVEEIYTQSMIIHKGEEEWN